jgi:hypothetical protein
VSTTKRVAGLLGAATLAAAGLVITPSAPALAGENAKVGTDDPGDIGAMMYWEHSEDHYRVCDTDADGVHAWGRAFYRDNGRWKKLPVVEVAGNDECSSWYGRNLREGTRVRIKVCLQNGAHGRLRHCDSDPAEA